MDKTTTFKKFSLLVAGLAFSFIAQVHAAPNGNFTLLGGTTQFLIAEFPPEPGNYLQFTSSYTTASISNDEHGNASDIDLKVGSQTLRFMTVWDISLLDADITASDLIGTYVDFNNRIQTGYGEIEMNDDGLADVLFEPLILQWSKGRNKQLQMITGLGFVLPIGSYSKAHDFNVAGHYFSIAPHLAAKYKFKNGLELGVSPLVNINWENQDAIIAPETNSLSTTSLIIM